MDAKDFTLVRITFRIEVEMNDMSAPRSTTRNYLFPARSIGRRMVLSHTKNPLPDAFPPLMIIIPPLPSISVLSGNGRWFAPRADGIDSFSRPTATMNYCIFDSCCSIASLAFHSGLPLA